MIVTKPTIMTKIALDSNVILYALDEEESDRKHHALTLFQNSPYFSSQAFSEVLNVCRKRWKFNKERLIRIADFLLENGRIIPVDATIIKVSHSLIARYHFQYFDALIVSSALTVGCDVLYTEDMQHKLYVNKALRILNPFVE